MDYPFGNLLHIWIFWANLGLFRGRNFWGFCIYSFFELGSVICVRIRVVLGYIYLWCGSFLKLMNSFGGFFWIWFVGFWFVLFCGYLMVFVCFGLWFQRENLVWNMANRNLEKMASIDAQLRLLVPAKVSEDDKLVEYDALLLDRFLDILQDLHGEDLKETVSLNLEFLLWFWRMNNVLILFHSVLESKKLMD